jgi:hypothetical protein
LRTPFVGGFVTDDMPLFDALVDPVWSKVPLVLGVIGVFGFDEPGETFSGKELVVGEARSLPFGFLLFDGSTSSDRCRMPAGFNGRGPRMSSASGEIRRLIEGRRSCASCKALISGCVSG